MSICKEYKCFQKVIARGWCSKHYNRWYRHGNPQYVPYYDTPQGVFDYYTIPVTETGCLLWLGGLTDGYGVISINRKQYRAHKWNWENIHGQVPHGYVLDHTCHTRACVNDSHLRLATFAQNSANRVGLGTRNTSGYRNVTWHNYKNKWMVIVKDQFIGYFDDVHEAGRSAKQARKLIFGEFAGKG